MNSHHLRPTRGLPGVLWNLYAPMPAGRPYRCRLLYPKLLRADNQIADKGYGSDQLREALEPTGAFS